MWMAAILAGHPTLFKRCYVLKDCLQDAPSDNWKNKFMLSVGQYNLADYAIRDRSTPTVISKMINAFGLEKPWRNLRHVKHVEADKMIEYFVECIPGRDDELLSARPLALSKQLITHIASIPFEQAIIYLHLCTGMYVHRYRYLLGSAISSGPEDGERNEAPVEACEKLSNYMMYLLAVHPSMLPVSSTAAHEALTEFCNLMKSISYNKGSKLEIMERALKEPYEVRFPTQYLERRTGRDLEPITGPDLERSLVEMKVVWTRLLAYAAGKCRGELHARQLGDGGELITFVWLLMLHHNLGDAAYRELKLSQYTGPQMTGSTLEYAVVSPPPLYAFPDRD